MDAIASLFARKCRAMTREDALKKAVKGKIDWIQAAFSAHQS